MNWVLVAVLVYLVLQLGISAWIAPRIHDTTDYLVAGRKLGYPLAVFSIFATWFGAETCIAAAGRAFDEGFALTTAEPFAYGVTLIAMGVIFAVPLWRRKLTTLADFFRQRYGPGVERLAAIVLIPASILWAAAQLRGFGHVLTSITSLDLGVAIAAAAGFCVLYTMLGGLLADAITDLIQGLLVVAGLAALVVAVVLQQGGLGPTLALVDTARITLVGPEVTPTVLGLLEEYAIPIAGSVVAVELVSRVIAARSPAVARNSAVIAGGLYIVVGILPVFLGLAAGGLVGELADAEQFLPVLARTVLPTALYVLFAGALISAILSTIDTILLVTSGLATQNVVAPLLNIRTEAARLAMARGGVVVFGALSLLLALRAQGVAELVEDASAFGSAGVLVVISFGLFTPLGGTLAATASLAGGLVTYVGGTLAGIPYPFITSLAAAAGLYLLAAWREPRHEDTAAGIEAHLRAS